MKAEEVWGLHHEGRLVARLHVSQIDFPWLEARLESLEGFDAVAALFEEELRQVESLQDVETPEWAAAYDNIRTLTRLTYPDGRDVPEYLLHIDGDRAWWRWSGEPFEETAEQE